MKRCSIALVVSLLCLRLLAQSDSLVITMTGDVLLDRGVRETIERASSAEQAFNILLGGSIDSVFHHSNVVIGNLECPATKIKRPIFKRFMFRGEPEWLAELQRHGFTHLNLANNHSIDQSREGLVDTWQQIQHYGMVPLSAGNNMEEALQPVRIATVPRNVWFLGRLSMPLENFPFLTEKPSVAQEPIDSLAARIKILRRHDPSAYIIVSLHWGWEHRMDPLPFQRQQAHQLIDAGADILVCHHTHTLQTIEQYKGHSIYYSIGNFIFDQKKPINSQACMVKIVVEKDTAKVKTLPVTIHQCRPTLCQ